MNEPLEKQVTEKTHNWRPIEPITSVMSLGVDYNNILSPEIEFRNVNPLMLFIDDSYQRTPTRATLRLVRKIISDWDWRQFKPPICLEVAGELHVIDGQHTALAAATHPSIYSIPVMIVKGSTDLVDRAKAFVGHNTNRVSVTPIQLFKANLEAGDDECVGVNMALVSTRVALVHSSLQMSDDENAVACTSSISELKRIYKNYGFNGLKTTLQICVNAKIENINQYHLSAISDMMHNSLYKKMFRADDLSLVIRNYPTNKFLADVEIESREKEVKRSIIAISLLSARYRSHFTT